MRVGHVLFHLEVAAHFHVRAQRLANFDAVDGRAQVLDGFLVRFLLRQLFQNIRLSVGVTHGVEIARHFSSSVLGHLVEFHGFSSFGDHQDGRLLLHRRQHHLEVLLLRN